MTLWCTVTKLWCHKLCAVFFGPPCIIWNSDPLWPAQCYFKDLVCIHSARIAPNYLFSYTGTLAFICQSAVDGGVWSYTTVRFCPRWDRLETKRPHPCAMVLFVRALVVSCRLSVVTVLLSNWIGLAAIQQFAMKVFGGVVGTPVCRSRMVSE